ncbi:MULTISPECIES: SAM-dependent methyltransferase [unclassified Pseudomonas]|uniref:SAM-dependent methyltransferase n=1 Tax=unclassified Pseudomonas TaxID=196821 RepID=UPI000CD2379E|nr:MULTISPECIES: SAM-dependent methyltransferase [unclassified Pseudomonas]POA51182.1 SAM-dependent methyltransferase [Pseudomonas sp. FW507-12TSA]
MNADFLDAHQRHMVDAEMLFLASRLANSDQLFGFAAECGLKTLMLHFGMVIKQDGSPKGTDDRVHADKVWGRYDTYRANSVHGANYALPSQNPFQDWGAPQRYVHSGEILQPRVDAHRAAAGAVAALVRKARLEGLI